jgi:hypothetical protein
MIPFIIICGLLLALHLPVIGGMLFKALQHGLLHIAAHHEDAFIYGLSLFLVSLVLLAAASIFLGWYWIVGDAAIVILILRSLLRADQGH